MPWRYGGVEQRFKLGSGVPSGCGASARAMPLRGPTSRRHTLPKWTPGAHFVTRLVNGRYVSSEVRGPAEAPPPTPSEEAATEASDAAPPPAAKGTRKTKRKYEKRSPYWNDANKHWRQRKADKAAPQPQPRPQPEEEVAEEKGPGRRPSAVFGQVTSWLETASDEHFSSLKEKRKRKKKAETEDVLPKQKLRRKEIGRGFGWKEEMALFFGERNRRVIAETDDEGDDEGDVEGDDEGTDVQPASATESVPVVLPWVSFLGDKDGLSRKWEAKVGQHYAGLYSMQADAFLASAQLAMHAAASRGAGAGAGAGGSAGLKAQLLAGPEGAELRAASAGPMRDVVDHLLGLASEQLCNRAGFEKLDVPQFAKRLRIEARGGTGRYPYVEAVDARVQEPERKWKASVELPDPRPGQGQRTLRFELGRYKTEAGGANVAAVFMAHVLATGFPETCNSAAAFRTLMLESHYGESIRAAVSRGRVRLTQLSSQELPGPGGHRAVRQILAKMWDHYTSSKVPAEYRAMSVLEFAKEMNFTFHVMK